MSEKDAIAVLYSIENDLRLQAVIWSRTFFDFLMEDKRDEAQRAQGIYEGLQTAIAALKEKRRDLEEKSDTGRDRKSAQKAERDPKTARRD